MNVGIVVQESQYVFDNTAHGSLERIRQLYEVFAAYAEGEFVAPTSPRT